MNKFMVLLPQTVQGKCIFIMCLFSALEGKENNITMSTLRGKGSKMNLLTATEVAQTPL